MQAAIMLPHVGYVVVLLSGGRLAKGSILGVWQ
jgi:hypothetical protein